MLTLFTIPKAFDGNVGVIQRNAIKSWTLLRPECDVILFGNDPGTAEAAEELGVRHIRDVAGKEYGTPRVDSIYYQAEEAAQHDLLCHVNADIILMNDFSSAVENVLSQRKWFLLTDQRWNVDIETPLDFSAGWEMKLKRHIAQHGELGARTGFDYLVFPRGLMVDLPPFTTGRTAYDQWFLYQARKKKATVIDATPVVMDVHQNHDYSHHQVGNEGNWANLERQRNLEMAGGRQHLFIIKDRTEVLTPSGLRRTRD